MRTGACKISAQVIILVKRIEYDFGMLKPHLQTTPRLPDNGIDLNTALLEEYRNIPFDSIRCVIINQGININQSCLTWYYLVNNFNSLIRRKT